MKKTLCLLLIFFCVVSILFFLSNRSVSEHIAHLDEEYLLEKISISPFDWHITETSVVSDNTVAYLLKNTDDDFSCCVISTTDKKHKKLQIIFPLQYEATEAIVDEMEIADAFDFATDIYGKFKHPDQLFQKFQAEFPNKNTTIHPIGKTENTVVDNLSPVEHVVWRTKLEGCHIIIKFGRDYPESVPDRMNLIDISISTSKKMLP